MVSPTLQHTVPFHMNDNCLSIWESYAIQAPELSLIRASLLVRVLAVDAQPFQGLLDSLLDGQTNWESR